VRVEGKKEKRRCLEDMLDGPRNNGGQLAIVSVDDMLWHPGPGLRDDSLTGVITHSDMPSDSETHETLYFGYGSNIWIDQMNRRCPENKYIGTAVLNDW
jgi:hypothetical protein